MPKKYHLSRGIYNFVIFVMLILIVIEINSAKTDICEI